MKVAVTLFIGFIVSNKPALCQDYRNDLSKIKTIEEAEAYVRSHPNANGSVTTVDLSTLKSNKMMVYTTAKVGEIVSINDRTVKILESAPLEKFWVNYISFDGSKLRRPQIDSLRHQVMEALKNGQQFEDLADRYNGENLIHLPGGQLSFDGGKFGKEFEEAIRQHQRDDIFFFDEPDKSVYYVIRKTADIYETRVLTVLIVGGKH